MNKYYAIAYKLTTIKDGVKKMEEEATADDPFVFISGFGTTSSLFLRTMAARSLLLFRLEVSKIRLF